MRTILSMLALVAIASSSALAQQIARYSMYMQNFYVLNPAAAGMEDHIDATLGYRKQWVGFQNSPQSYFASVNAALNPSESSPEPASVRISNPSDYQRFDKDRKVKHGAGGMVMVTELGAFGFTQANATYAVHVPVAEQMNVSFGLNGGGNFYSIDQSVIRLEDPNDPFYSQAIANAQSNASQIDLDFGLMLYSPKFFLGYASEQILGKQLNYGSQASGEGALVVHHKLSFGGVIRKHDWKFVPSGFVYMAQSSVLSAEFNFRADYHDQLWAGVSYRLNDAIIPMVGMYINNRIKFGYAFDNYISTFGQYRNGGSHELMLGFMLGNLRRF